MKDLNFTLPVADAGSTFYIPAPCRGVVVSARVTCDINMVAAGTIVLGRSTTAVNTITVPTGDKAAGTALDGVPDATNKDLIFDPDSATAANRVIKIAADGTLLASAGNVSFHIRYDDSAHVTQAASEA
jgi:hypothetical protein